MTSTFALNETFAFNAAKGFGDHYGLGLVDDTPQTLADQQNARYQLREEPRGTVRILTTWLDTDQSGNYDPIQDPAPPSPPPSPKRKRERYREDDDSNADGNDRPKKIKTQPERSKGLTKFLEESASGIITVPNYTRADYSRPGIVTPAGLDLESPYLTRSRLKPGQLEDPEATQSRESIGLQTPSDSAQWRALMEEPAMQSCKACLKFQLPCSLAEDPSDYPCSTCREDECDCELIVPPPKKRACESCRESRVHCSYRDGGDHTQPCERCRRRGSFCCAGPELEVCQSKGGNDTMGFVPTPERPYLNCTPCRRAKKWCSLGNKKAQPPCRACSREGVGCTFEKIPRKKRIEEELSVDEDLAESEISESDANERQSSPERSGDRTRKIQTRFAHPIAFNNDPPQNGSRPCHWCAWAPYGVVGLGPPLTVEVLAKPSQQGHFEVSGGYTARGKEPSRMCADCTMDRLSIASCPSHQTQPIPGLNPDMFDFEAAWPELVSHREEAREWPPTLWCSICPSPAFFECASPQEQATPGDEDADADPPPPGCGLVLCDGCATILVEDFERGLSRMIAAVERDEEEYPFGLRADVGFLRSEGELVQRILKQG